MEYDQIMSLIFFFTYNLSVPASGYFDVEVHEYKFPFRWIGCSNEYQRHFNLKKRKKEPTRWSVLVSKTVLFPWRVYCVNRENDRLYLRAMFFVDLLTICNDISHFFYSQK